ncbi:MAG: hypothetical protein KDD38_07630, partial [Bdellovibrionales bacterium]|nr:hypothetical protein [Bdellovibrionales bacterium]
VVKNRVSHSNIKTKFMVQPNIQKKQIFSSALNRSVGFKIATSALRDMEHVGGFDTYILNQDDKKLSARAKAVKGKIRAQLKRKQPKTKKSAASKAKGA